MVTIVERCAASILHMMLVLFEDSRELARRAGVKRRKFAAVAPHTECRWERTASGS
jgi:hypothetical protein